MKAITGALTALLAIAAIAFIMLSYGFHIGIIGGPGSAGESVVLRVNDYTMRQALLAAKDYLDLSLRYSGYQACRDSGLAGALWWDSKEAGPDRAAYGADIASRARASMAAYSKSPYRFLDLAVALPESWDVSESEGSVRAAASCTSGQCPLRIERVTVPEKREEAKKGEELVALSGRADFSQELPWSCLARFSEGKRLSPLLAAEAKRIAQEAVASLAGMTGESRVVEGDEATFKYYTEGPLAQSRMADAVMAGKRSLAEREADAEAAAKKATPAVPESNAFTVTATIDAVAVTLTPRCSAVAQRSEGAVTGVAITCSFERSADVTLLATLTSTDGERSPVWNGNALALEPLPLQFRVRERSTG